MERRKFLKNFGAGMAAAGAATLAAPAKADSMPAIRWRMASSFPKSLDTVYGGAEMLAERVKQLTDGKFNIRVFAGGEIVPGLQVLDAVQQGTVECGHSASYYYVGKNKAYAFDCSIPFGLNARQQNAWMYYGGGLQLMREFFAKSNVYNIPGGNTGTQMGGWFRKEVKSLADLKGLKMRIPGFGGEVMSRLGVVPQTLAGGDVYPSLERGTIDATEWVGPYDDEKLGFYKIAKNYYYPGFWEGSTQFSFYINLAEWNKLPKLYQQALEVAAAETNINVMAEYDHKNPQAIQRLIKNGVKVHAFPQDIMKAAHKAAFEIFEEEAAKNPDFKKIYASWKPYRDQQYHWFGMAEGAFASLASLG
ncbi:MAG: TRAP transporter substrate-binding protein [Sulfurimicrobium sp.]|jgi:TRAP-type mannitol/chloroaromatic compound transport system substrate-binding protein|nr:TRAP transporter substrate-binding protein [Sulfurimicrobium sp.]MDP3688976.1 TRAP transporter substrate-binding protein [Sulfurimicrobium sp.]